MSKEATKKYKYILKDIFAGKEIEANSNDVINELLKYIVDSIENKYKLYSNLVLDIKDITHYDDMNYYDVQSKVNLIKELLKLLNTKSDNANLSDFELNEKKCSTAFGKKNGRIISSCKIINKSCTGIWENEHEF